MTCIRPRAPAGLCAAGSNSLSRRDIANANARLTGRVPVGNGQQAATELGTAQVRVTHLAQLPPNALRVLGGVQLNLFVVKLFVHGNLLMRDPVLTSLGGGVRLAY